MFKVDKEDGLFTLGSVFLVFRNNKLLYLMMFQDDSSTSKKWKVFTIDPVNEVLESMFHDFKLPWKNNHDSIGAKHVSKSIESIEKLGFDIWFWTETLKENQTIQNFYLQNIIPKLK